MVAIPRFRLSLVPQILGLGVGVLVAAVFALMPVDPLHGVVAWSGIPTLLPVAAPPLGITARALLALSLGTGAGAIAWAATFLLLGPGGTFAREGGRDGMPEVRAADAHPDAPPRRPLSAADLAAPIAPPVVAPVEQPVPSDLDQPLAAFDPHSILAAPREPIRPVPPLAAPLPPPIPEVRIEPRLSPQPERRPEPLKIRREPRPIEERADGDRGGAPDTGQAAASSIESLLARLERGAARRRPS